VQLTQLASLCLFFFIVAAAGALRKNPPFQHRSSVPRCALRSLAAAALLVVAEGGTTARG